MLLVINIHDNHKYISKLQNLLTRLNQKDIEYFDEQFMYGHRETLLYATKQSNPTISQSSILEAGLLHGWAFDSSIWRLRKRNLRRAPRYVWIKKHETELSKNTKNISIGSPWLYLLKQLEFRKFDQLILRDNESRREILIFPGHNLLYTNKNIANQVSLYRNFADGKSATVCLFWLDFLNLNTRQAYENAGFKVTCMGYAPRGKFGYANVGGRVEFLLNLAELFASHDHVVADELGSGILYAASVGKRITLLPDQNASNIQKELSEIMGEHKNFYVTADDWMQDNRPELWTSGKLSKDLIQIAWDELGENSILSEEELQKLPWVESNAPIHLMEIYESGIERLKQITVNRTSEFD